MTNPFEPTKDPAPTVEAKDNWVSFTFASAAGYDRIGGTVHGEPKFVAELFGIEDFDGKVSTLMKRATLVDQFFKGTFQEANPGKA